jgi:hypothetical protein
LENIEENPLWPILVDTVHALPLYPSHKSYTRDHLLVKDSNLTPKEIVYELDITLGEAMVILNELNKKGS